MKKIFITCRLSFGLLLILTSAICHLTSNINAQGTWTQKSNFPGGKRFAAIGFSIGSKGYIGTGIFSSFSVWYKDLWEWDQATDIWTQKANLPDTARAYATGFSIAGKGYICTGYNWNVGYIYKALWQYDPALNTWTQKANFPGTAREGSTSFTIGYKAYVGTGDQLPGSFKDFWEYDAPSNSWIQKSDFPISRGFAAAFSIGNKGYLGTGSNYGVAYNDFWEFDPAANTWTQKANLPALTRDDATGFSIGNYGYMGLGDSINFQTSKFYPLSDFWQYSPYTNSWTKMANYPGVPVSRASGFTIGCRGYAGTGWSGPTNFTGALNEFWEFTPPVPSAVVAGINTICAGDSTSLFAAGGLFYKWSTGETTKIIEVNPTTTTAYSVIVFDACGADTANITVTVIPYPIISVQYKPDLCGTGVVQFTDSSTNAIAWSWDFGDGHTDTAQNPANVYPSAGQYIVTVTVSPSPFGCTTKSQFTVDIPSFSELFIPTAFSPNDDDNNDVYYVFGSCITQMNFTIYNRWGEEVYSYEGAPLPLGGAGGGPGWDGTFKGEKQNAGVYMYSFTGTLTTGEDVNKKGNITLMR